MFNATPEREHTMAAHQLSMMPACGLKAVEGSRQGLLRVAGGKRREGRRESAWHQYPVRTAAMV